MMNFRVDMKGKEDRWAGATEGESLAERVQQTDAWRGLYLCSYRFQTKPGMVSTAIQ